MFNFLQFIEWPRLPSSSAKLPFSIWVVGNRAWGQELKEVFRGESYGDRPIEVQVFRTAPASGSCAVICFESGSNAKVPDLTRFQKTGVLTIGETTGFIQAGGILNFFIKGNKVAFEVSVENARRAGLLISSKVLNLARIVPSATR